MKIFFLMVIVAMSIFSRGEDECVTTPIKAMDSSSSGHLSGLSNVKSVHPYRGQIVALRNNGDVYLWRTQEKDLIKLGSFVRKLLVFEEDTLVVLKESGELWVFQGRPGDPIVTYITTLMPGPNGTSIPMMIPSYGGRREAFLDTAISGVESMVARDDDILIRDIYGQEKSYRSIGPSLDDLDSGFSKKVPGNRFTCRFKGKEKDYPVEALWFQKESGTLYATVSYKIQGAWFNNSPTYRIPLAELAYYRNRDLWVMSELFQKFIQPASSGSWAVEMCFNR